MASKVESMAQMMRRGSLGLAISDAGLLGVFDFAAPVGPQQQSATATSKRARFLSAHAPLVELSSFADFKVFMLQLSAALDCECDDLMFLRSSSVDFPREYTDNAEVIALCKAITG